MLNSLKKINGHKLAAFDGEMGHVKDFYFDDKSWAIRYLVADTGHWLPGRQVLISPHAFGKWDRDGKVLQINLTRKQIENSPSIDLHRPISRQYEENYYEYYGWPIYWEGGGVWGAGDYPVFAPSPRPYALERYEYPRWDDIHLRSVIAATGYGIHASDGVLGKVSDFLVDQEKWVIQEVAMETGHWYSGKEILLTTGQVERISYEESKIFVRLKKADLEQTEAYHVAIARD